MPIHGPLPVTVPGMVGGWSTLAAPRRGAAVARPARRRRRRPPPTASRCRPGLAESIAETAPELGRLPRPGGAALPRRHAPRRRADAVDSPPWPGRSASSPTPGRPRSTTASSAQALCAGLAARGVPMTRPTSASFRVDEAATAAGATSTVGAVQAGRPSSQAYLVLRLLGMLDTVDAGDDDAPLHRRIPARAAGARVPALLAEERDAILADARFMTQSSRGPAHAGRRCSSSPTASWPTPARGATADRQRSPRWRHRRGGRGRRRGAQRLTDPEPLPRLRVADPRAEHRDLDARPRRLLRPRPALAQRAGARQATAAHAVTGAGRVGRRARQPPARRRHDGRPRAAADPRRRCSRT